MPNSAVFRRPFTKRGQNWLPPGRAITLIGDVTGSGGVVLGGTADVQFTNIVGSATGSGGVELGGTSPILYTHFIGRKTGAGGVEVGGTALVSSNRIVYPERRLSSKVELRLNGQWTDITSYVYNRDKVSITRGRSNEATVVDRSTCRLTLNNRDGRFTPRNAIGPYYGTIGRNTPIRVSLGHGSTFLSMPGNAGEYISTPSSAALSITGDIDIRIDLATDRWRTQSVCFGGKSTLTGNQRSWRLLTNGAGRPFLSWSADGATLNTIGATEVITVGPSGRKALRVTLDVDNGAGGNDLTFYTADTIDGPWEQLGGVVTTAGTTSLFDSTAPLKIGDVEFGVTFPGRCYAFQLRDGIGGTLVADLDFASFSSGVPTALDDCGNTWTPTGDIAVTNHRPRFYGEVSNWPQKWDISGSDVYTPIEAAGILRRLTAGASQLRSPLFRSYPRLTSLLAYWPGEDGRDSVQLASGIAGGAPMTFTGPVELASADLFVASSPLPNLAGSTWTGIIPSYTATGAIQTRWLMSVPSTGATDAGVICSVYTTGTAARWDLRYGTGGTLGLLAYDSAGTEILNTGQISFALDGNPVRASVELQQSGSDVAWILVTIEPGTSGQFSGGTLSSRTIGRTTKVVMNPAGALTDVTIGHITVQSAITTIFDSSSALAGYAGETAASRMLAVCAEEGVPIVVRGDPALTAQVGAQPIGTLMNVLRDAAAADGGILMEDRESSQLVYRTRASMYNQDPRLALDHDDHVLGASMDPVDDDQTTRNDITVTRTRGSFFQATLDEGVLSIQDPPDGVGRYVDSATLNVHRDAQLGDHAHWLVHLGTVDEARYPRLVVNMANRAIAYDVGLTSDAMDLDVGDRLDVENPPPWLPPETIAQLAQGFTETFGTHEYQVDVNCAPESPWEIARYLVDRYDTDGSELGSDVSSSDTSLSVVTAEGPLWTTEDVPFDIRIGGEQVTVAAVSGTSSPQTFTVTRAVNGVVKGHTAGASVSLWTPAIVGL